MAKRIRLNLFYIVFLLLITVPGKSQVVLVPEIQTEGLVLKQQLWSVMINNMSGQQKKAVMTVSMADRASSQVLIEATSGLIVLNPGVRRVTYNDLSPLNWTVTTAGFGMDRQLNQPLPVGEYLVCYKLTDPDNKQELLANECVKVVASPLSPPQLVLPENGSIILDIRPVLTWTPPTPINMFSSLSYDIIVSPLYENQSPEEALQRNFPVLTTSSASQSLPYASSFTNLEQGNTYVWQVAAKDAGRYGAKSEVFSFTIMPDSVTQIISMAPYIKLDKSSPQTTVMHQGVLKIEYYNAYGDTTVKVEAYVMDETKLKGKKNISFELKVRPGQNFLEYKMNNRIRLEESLFYGIRLTNSRGEQWYMRFNPKYYF